MRKIIYTLITIVFLASSMQGLNLAVAETATPKKTTAAYSANPIRTTSLGIVKNPQIYLNKSVVMDATFDKFSTLGLDYKPAMRSSDDYIGILIKRDDVIDHTIPLSEMKLFLKRDLAEKNINLETDDKVQITGKVFSTALGDPWIDITEIKILQKNPKSEKK